MERKISTKIQGYRTVDGAGVSLVRVLGNHTTEEFDPILMLDSFDSTNPNDYIAGFPMHPHRGIETISYIAKGKMVHKDTLGNEEAVGKAIQETNVPREELFITTKVWISNYGYEKAKASVEESLKKMQLDYLDLVLLHQPFKDYHGAFAFSYP